MMNQTKSIAFSILVIILLFTSSTKSYILRSYISQHGLHGEIEISKINETYVGIRTNLKPTLEYPDQVWSWSIHQFAVDYRNIEDSRCSNNYLGDEIIKLTNELGYLFIPDNQTVEFVSKNALLGKHGFWGKSIVLKSQDGGKTICASIVATDKMFEKMAVAQFLSPIAGSITLRWIASDNFDSTDMNIITDLYHTKTSKTIQKYTQHKWKIYATDIFDEKNENFEGKCNVLQTVFDPENKGEGKSIGDLDERLGLIRVANNPDEQKAKMFYAEDSLSLLPSDMESSKRSLYIVLFDPKHLDSFIACAKIRIVSSKIAKSVISMDGVKGEVTMTQASPYDPTWVNFTLYSSDESYESALRFVSSVHRYEVRELPPKWNDADGLTDVCNTTGSVFNPRQIDLNHVPPPGFGTQDQYPIGDLLGKYKDRTQYLNHKYLLPGLSSELSGLYWDILLPLENVHSIIHRSLVITRHENKSSLCGVIHQYDPETKYRTEMRNAQILFRYPLVGKIVLRQPMDRPWEDTTIIVEYLIHADGANVNNTFEHRWAVHENPPGKDFYNWTARCLSAKSLLDLHHVNMTDGECKYGLDGLCRVGDLTARHGTLSIAGRKLYAASISRKLLTDPILALSGKYSILRRSLVIYDDHGPVARGERMACSLITGLYRRKAVVHDWFGNGDSSIRVGGKIEFLQQSEYDLTNVRVELEGLDDVKTYRIHEAPVQAELDFPCENSTLYETYNPFHIQREHTPPPEKGTFDQYPLGDLGNKYGLIDGMNSIRKYLNETQVTLFGTKTILGRSVVLHKKSKNLRWACSSIERGYSPSEAREIRAIASFHHPQGFARGYVRMTQLIYNDGSQSDTVIEVNLRHPGVMDRNVTHNHKWAIYVNPVGVDATVKTATRCVAAGYVWNPYYTQLADPLNHDLYEQECGPDNPLRCYVGDLSARLGLISLGTERQMFSDSNFPLEGTVTALGRSIVIMGPELSNDRYACANIEPDKDIVKYANIQKPPRFIITQFMEDIRKVMGVPEWMLSVDARKTKNLHENTCIQILLHFKGAEANRLEQDFTKLLATGRLESPSIYIPGFIDQKRKSAISYKECEGTDPNEKKKKKSTLSIFSFGGDSSDSIMNTQLNNYVIIITCISLVIIQRIF